MTIENYRETWDWMTPEEKIHSLRQFREYAVANSIQAYVIKLVDNAICAIANQVAKYASTGIDGRFEACKQIVPRRADRPATAVTIKRVIRA